MNETEIIKDKIQEILRTQKISKYDLALDIGISHATLYNFLSGIDISQKCLNKLAHFVRTYVTPEQKIEAYKLDAIEYEAEIKELKAENEQLKEEIKEVKKYQYQQEYLDKEIKEMQKALKTLAEGLNKRQILLQEIKEICKNSHTSASKDYYRTADKIIQKITKAEEE